METVTLRNGAVEAKCLVDATLLSLGSLLEEQPTAFYELHQLALNSQHKLFGNTSGKLRDTGLLESGDRLHSSIRSIVLAYVDGEGLNLRLLSAPEGLMRSQATEGDAR